MHLLEHDLPHDTCVICFESEQDAKVTNEPRITCECRASTCRDCLVRYVTYKLEQPDANFHPAAGGLLSSILCPSPYCKRRFTRKELVELVGHVALSNMLTTVAPANNGQRQGRGAGRSPNSTLARVQQQPKCRDCRSRLKVLPIAFSRHWIVLRCENPTCEPTAGSIVRRAAITAMKALRVPRLAYETHHCVFCQAPKFMSGALGGLVPACCHSLPAEQSDMRVVDTGEVATTDALVSRSEALPSDQGTLAAWYLKQDPDTVRCCPTCLTFIEKTEGCDRVKCACGTAFCWRCLVPMSEHRQNQCNLRSFDFDMPKICNKIQAGVKTLVRKLSPLFVLLALFWVQPWYTALFVGVPMASVGSLVGALKLRDARARRARHAGREKIRQRRIDAQKQMVTRGIDLYVVSASKGKREGLFRRLLQDLPDDGSQRGRQSNLQESQRGVRAVLYPNPSGLTAVLVRVCDGGAGLGGESRSRDPCVVEYCLDAEGASNDDVGVVDKNGGAALKLRMRTKRKTRVNAYAGGVVLRKLEARMQTHIRSHLHG